MDLYPSATPMVLEHFSYFWDSCAYQLNVGPVLCVTMSGSNLSRAGVLSPRLWLLRV